MNIWLSEIDSDRFGAVIAKANLSPGDDIGSIESWCTANRVAMLIVRCATEQLDAVQQLERCGAQLMDTLVYYQKLDVTPCMMNLPNGYRTRLATPDDAAELKRLAMNAFSGFFGHYHADLRLERDACDMVYGSWAANSCLSKQIADDVLLIERGNVIAGFLTLKCKGVDTVEIILNAVDPQCQGVGLYSALVGLAMNWTAERGLSKLIVSTQVTNLAPQKVWCRYGFEPHSSFYTLHKWF